MKIVYYDDLLNDDFAKNKIVKKDFKNYRYHFNMLDKIVSFVLYYILAIPILYIINGIKNGNKIKNKKILKKNKNSYFIYSNHTMLLYDAYKPALSNIRKKAYVLCNKDAVSIPFLSNVVKLVGGLPKSDNMAESIKLYKQIKELISNKKSAICIYPEAHVWPYSSFVRPFKEDSFIFPAKLDSDIYVMTTYFKKRRFSKKPKAESIITGPFKADASLSLKDKTLSLRNIAYQQLKENMDKYNEYEYIKYLPRN